MTKNLVLVVMMINSKIIVFFLFLVWALPFPKTGNAQTTDFRLRAGLSIQKDFTKKLKASVDYEHRFDNYLTTFDQALIEPSVSYEIKKFLSVGAEWRLMADQDLQRRISYKQRGALFIRFKKSIDDFDFKFKSAIQYGFDDLTNNSSNNRKKIINRNSFSVDYNWFGSRFTPFAGYEFFYDINNPNGGIINQSRVKLGTSYRVSKASEISAYYIFENEFNIANPVDAHIIGFGYRYKF
jgi:hypothetical protein